MNNSDTNETVLSSTLWMLDPFFNIKTDGPALFCAAQSLLDVHNRLTLDHKAATATHVNPHVARVALP